MPELIILQGKYGSINIVETIGDRWQMVGIALLNDENGTIVQAIADECRGHAERINLKILQRWTSGEGISDRTWRRLLSVLRVQRPRLAESVEEALTTDMTAEDTGKSLSKFPANIHVSFIDSGSKVGPEGGGLYTHFHCYDLLNVQCSKAGLGNGWSGMIHVYICDRK